MYCTVLYCTVLYCTVPAHQLPETLEVQAEVDPVQLVARQVALGLVVVVVHEGVSKISQYFSQYSLKDYLEVVVVAVEGLGHVGGDVGVAAGEEHVDHVRGEGRHLHTREHVTARGRVS